MMYVDMKVCCYTKFSKGGLGRRFRPYLYLASPSPQTHISSCTVWAKPQLRYSPLSIDLVFNRKEQYYYCPKNSPMFLSNVTKLFTLPAVLRLRGYTLQLDTD